VAHAWLPGARRIRAKTDGGPLKGGAPRAVWLTLETAPGSVSVQSAASRLITEERPCHIIWDPATGEAVQLISILRAGCALGSAEHSTPADLRGAATIDVNTEGRVCVQIGVLGHPAAPFTSGPMDGVASIVSWLDSWGVPRHWPAGEPASSPGPGRGRALWALGGHFGASQVPGCAIQGPGRIDTNMLTGTHILQVHQREPRYSLSPAVLPIPA
jgi:hypothetical protein